MSVKHHLRPLKIDTILLHLPPRRSALTPIGSCERARNAHSDNTPRARKVTGNNCRGPSVARCRSLWSSSGGAGRATALSRRRKRGCQTRRTSRSDIPCLARSRDAADGPRRNNTPRRSQVRTPGCHRRHALSHRRAISHVQARYRNGAIASKHLQRPGRPTRTGGRQQ